MLWDNGQIMMLELFRGVFEVGNELRCAMCEAGPCHRISSRVGLLLSLVWNRSGCEQDPEQWVRLSMFLLSNQTGVELCCCCSQAVHSGDNNVLPTVAGVRRGFIQSLLSQERVGFLPRNHLYPFTEGKAGASLGNLPCSCGFK